MKKIELTKGKHALIDDKDFDWLNQWKWFFSNGYAARFIYLGGGRKNGKYKMVFMHRLINDTPEDFETDHINRDKLDNRRFNLRTATRSLNTRNHPVRNNTSGHKGIDFYKRIKKWRVRLTIHKKNMSFGYFKHLEDAVRVRETAEIKYGYAN